MELKDKSGAVSDDEDDLEKLRLAALQTIKRNVHEEPEPILKYTNKPLQNHHKRRNFQGRNTRNGQFYARQKNTNLIAIPTIGNEIEDNLKNPDKSKFNNDGIPKLILPQDRYCKLKSLDDKPAESSSKFDRYDNSDKSESESECDRDSNSESESPGKLEKKTSLEALMEELENEIQGEPKPNDENIQKLTKPRKRKHKLSVSEISKENNVKEDSPSSIKNEQANMRDLNENTKIKEVEGDAKHDSKMTIAKINCNTDSNKTVLTKRFHKKHYSNRSAHNPATFVPYQSYTSPAAFSKDIHFNQNLSYQPIAPYDNSITLHQSLLPLNPPPNYIHPITTITSFDRPPSPLSLNTDDALTITRAPLSPRSAAFVLQNREIIERRKKSPRRSYSRSPSPRYRRSKSPMNYGRNNRSMSPRKYLKSKSRSPQTIASELFPRSSPGKEKIDGIREWRLSPLLDRKSPLQKVPSPLRDKRSPTRSKISPHRQKFAERRSPNTKRATPSERSPKTTSHNSPKTTIRERLGNRTNKKNTNDSNQTHKPRKESRSLSPVLKEVADKNLSPKEDVVDPVLEARRKKFESNEIKNTEGIIRLKPKIENSVENENLKESVININEDIALEEEVMDLLDPKVDDLFSDEDTDEENEGRFKSTLNEPKRNVSILSFDQLLDNSTKNVKADVPKSTNQAARVNEKESTTSRSRKRQRSRSPQKNRDTRNYKDRTKSVVTKSVNSRKASAKHKLYTRNRILFRNGSSRKEKTAVSTPRESKKIEIKIRNPSKYETTTKYDVANEHETLERIEKSVRKVEVSNVKKDSDEENDSEASNDNVGEAEENLDAAPNQKCEAGDLRAQLSRKRAERQNKLPIPEDVQSRLLQNALQGAVFKKPKKSRKEREPAPKGITVNIWSQHNIIP